MNKIPEDLYNKIVKISDQIRKDLRDKGIIIPVKNRDGSVSLGHYTIIKNKNNFYSVLDHKKEPIVEQINLPQTAAVVANNLALGRHLDTDLIKKDQQYGYAEFEESLYKQAVERSSTKTIDRFDLMITKFNIAKAKKLNYKHSILRSFEKLRKLA